MIVNTLEGKSRVIDMEDILEIVRSYNVYLNPTKCSYNIQTYNFIGFMLTNRGLEANPYKWKVIINIRSFSNVKEVQQLTKHLVSLPRLLS